MPPGLQRVQGQVLRSDGPLGRHDLRLAVRGAQQRQGAQQPRARAMGSGTQPEAATATRSALTAPGLRATWVVIMLVILLKSWC